MRLPPALLLASLTGLLPAAVAQPLAGDERLTARYTPTDWADTDLSWLRDSSPYAASRAQCASVRGSEPPAQDWPLLSQVAALEGCDSFALYHGLDGVQDFTKARHCALMEREGMITADFNVQPVLYGSGVLAMLYANGLGVERDLAVATHMACQMDGAPAEMDLRVTELALMRAKGWQGSDFTPCNHITSGLGAAHCTHAETRLASRDADMAFARLSANWPAGQRAALDDARRAFADYGEVANAMNGHGAGSSWPLVWQQSGAMEMTDRFNTRLTAIINRQTLPPAPVPEGPGGADFNRAATMTGAQWTALVGDWLDEDRRLLEDHRANAIAARRAFEPRLVAFLRLARPDLTAHQVRVLFRDL